MRKANPELHSRRRVQIISGAAACFLKRGFHQSSMQDIASAAGLSMGLLYRYFANKEAIIEAAAQQDQDATLEQIRQLPATGDVARAWAKFIIAMANEAATPDYAALANEIAAEAHRSAKLQIMLMENDAMIARAIAEKLTEQSQAGLVLASADIPAIAQTLLMFFDGLTTRRLVSGPHADMIKEAQIETLVSAILV